MAVTPPKSSWMKLPSGFELGIVLICKVPWVFAFIPGPKLKLKSKSELMCKSMCLTAYQHYKHESFGAMSPLSYNNKAYMPQTNSAEM